MSWLFVLHMHSGNALLISVPCEIVDANFSNVMLRQGPGLLETFGGTNVVWYACYYAYHTNIILLVAFR